MSEFYYAGLTSQTVDIFIADSSSTIGAGLSGLTYNTSGLVASYRKGATGTRTAITLATQTVSGAYSSGGFVEIEATYMKGLYRLDLPNAAVDTEGFISLYLYGAANMAPVRLRLDSRPLPTDVKKFGGAAGTFAAGIPETKVASIATDAIGSAQLSGTAVTEIQAGLMTSAGYTAPDNSSITAIKAKTDNLPSDPADHSIVIAATDAILTSVGLRATQTSVDDLPTNAELATAVNAQVLDVLTTDTFAELAAVPAATSSLKDKLTWLFMWARNKATETATQRKLYADNGTTVVSTEPVGDDDVTFTKGGAS